MEVSGKKDDDTDRPQPRYFATIDTKDVSTFEPPPKRVGSIPAARSGDRDAGPPRRAGVAGSSVTSSRTTTAPPLPSRNQSNHSLNGAMPQSTPPRTTAVPQKLPPPTAVRPPVKVTAPPLPVRREYVRGPAQDSNSAAPVTASRDSTYGQFRKTFGTAVDSNTVTNLRNALGKTSSASSPGPPAGSPSVTMADAKTASSIAQKYRKDPNSLTFADAKAGLSVANKILPPPQDTSPPNRQDLHTAASIGQKWNKDPKSLGWSDIKAGYAVANKFRPPPTSTAQPVRQEVTSEQTPPASGVNDLKSRFANISLGGIKLPATPSKSPPAIQTASRTPPSGKRPPPPPPPPKPYLAPTTSTSSPPVPVNLATKPGRAASTSPPSSWTPKDIPLDLDKGWYSTEPMQQIPYLSAHAQSAISASAISASGSGYAHHMIWVYTAVFAVRWTSDLSRTFIRVTWSSENPGSTVRATQKHFPPPTPLGSTDLEMCAGLYGPGVVTFAKNHMGQQVGNGECWTLAHDALEFVQGTVARRCMGSSGTIHGQCVYARDGGKMVTGDLESVRTGDIVQYLECKFERRVNGRVVQFSSAGAPDHTSYISPVSSPSRKMDHLGATHPSALRSPRFLVLVYWRRPLSFVGSLRGDGRMGALISCIRMRVVYARFKRGS